MIENKKYGMTEFDFNKIKGKTDKYKQFGSWYYPNNKPALCQIKNCKKKAVWVIGFKNLGRVFCMKHGEDL